MGQRVVQAPSSDMLAAVSSPAEIGSLHAEDFGVYSGVGAEGRGENNEALGGVRGGRRGGGNGEGYAGHSYGTRDWH